MGYQVVVAIFNSSKNLHKKVPSFRFWQFASLSDQVEKLSSFSIFHDDKNVARSIQNFIETDNIWVVEVFEEANFSFNLK
jgi:hypothetical protein